ncbi:MAG: redoxin family protein [Alphaproteobacteria bacterium]|nr:redoxin family protein [Alphaproteobacteria bacterium]
MRVKTQIGLLSLIAAAVLSYGILGYVYSSHKESSGAAVAPAQQRLPEAAFYDAQDMKHRLDEFKGEVLLVNLWATWCPPCVVELPSLDKLQAKLKDKNFRVVAISMDRSSILNVKSFLDEKNLDHLTAYWDKDRVITGSWQFSGLPATFLIDADGTVIQRYDGARDWMDDKVFKRIAALVKDKKK